MICEKQLVLNLFGSMEIRVGGQPIRRLRTRKGYWLLALMTLQHGRAVQREWLAGLLWPDSLESQARANLNLSITDLRKALGDEAYRLQSLNVSTLRLDLGGADCDLLAFDLLTAKKGRADRECAISLYRGALLEDCYEPWALAEREQREQAYLLLLEGMANEAAEREDWLLATHTLRVIVRRDPYRDSARRQLMQALYEGGDPNAALVAYQEFFHFLRQYDLRAQPDPETRQLYEQIRSKTRKLSEAPSSLPSVSSPLTMAPLPADSSVPARIAPLIGREQALLQIAMALRQSRLVTLTGSGGVGKTSLAMVVASQEGAAHAHGACFVALDVLTDPIEISDRILSVLGVRETSGRRPAEILMDFLANKEMLLVLDNLEHLMSTGPAQVQELLRHCPGLVILVTSRQSLGIADEVAWRVPSLPVPDPRRLPSGEEGLLQAAHASDAVRLFVERAAAKQAGFQLNLHNAQTIIEICSRLDGIPFAIELAAARTVALPVTELARRLNDCYRVLSNVNTTVLPRQQTLIALMEWSYRLLDKAEQTLLMRLSIFQGGFTLEAAETVCMEPPLEERSILDILTSLVNKSLVVYQQSEGTARYRLLETVKQYGAERLLQEDCDSGLCQKRHAAYFLDFAEQQEAHLTSAEQVTALDRLDWEYDNFQAALAWSAVSADTMETACRLAGALSYFWVARGYIIGGKRWFDELVPISTTVSAKVRGKLLMGAAYVAYSYGDSIRHDLYCDTALDVYRSLSDRLEYARCLVMKSRSWTLPDTETLEVLQESLEIFRAEQDTAGIADALSQMGTKQFAEIDAAQRIAWLEEGIQLYRERRDYRKIAVNAGELGYAILRSGGDSAAACALYEEMLSLSIHVKDGNTRSHALWLLGGAATLAEDYAAAEKYYAEGLEWIRQAGGKNGSALLLLSLAWAKQNMGKGEAARILAEESLALYRELGNIAYVEAARRLLKQIDAEPGSDIP